MPVLRSFLIALSHNRPLRRFFEHSSIGTRLNRRFIAGMKIDDALRVAESVNRQSIAVTLDSLGESVTSPAEAHRAADVYHTLLNAIAENGLDANISVKLTQMGLEQSPASPSPSPPRSPSTPAPPAASSASTWRTPASRKPRSTSCAAFTPAPSLRGALGIVIQAYLYRSQADVEQLLADGIRIRLCKGAYNEPTDVAFPRKSEVDANFLKLAKLLVDSPVYHGLATHDEA